MQYLKSQENILVSASILATEANQATWLEVVNDNVPWGGAFKVSLYSDAKRGAFTFIKTYLKKKQS